MKKYLFLFMMLIAFVECDFHKEDVTIPNRTPIEKDFCYEIQYMNEKGELVDGVYDCMVYYDTYGHDFQSAYEKLEPEINQISENFRKDYQNSEMWDANKLEIRTTKCPVRNAPNSEMEYTSVDFFMYNTKPYDDYIIIMSFRVIDSEGNLYVIKSGDD